MRSAMNQNGNTALMLAAADRYCDVEITECLLAHGADVNAQNRVRGLRHLLPMHIAP